MASPRNCCVAFLWEIITKSLAKCHAANSMQNPFDSRRKQLLIRFDNDFIYSFMMPFERTDRSPACLEDKYTRQWAGKLLCTKHTCWVIYAADNIYLWSIEIVHRLSVRNKNYKSFNHFEEMLHSKQNKPFICILQAQVQVVQ